MLKRLDIVVFMVFAPPLFLACTGNPTGPAEPYVYDRIVIDVHGPDGLGDPDSIDIALYLEEGGSLTELARDETPVDPGFIDTEGLGLTGGTYYIEVYHEKPPAEWGQAYTVRAVSLAPGEAVPDVDVPTALPTINWLNLDPCDFAGETYGDTMALLELDTNWLQRYLYAGSETDWLKFVLP